MRSGRVSISLTHALARRFDCDQEQEEDVRFRLARRAGWRLVSLRIMRSWLRKSAAVLGGMALVLICSCEKHHVGEIPEVQKEHVDPDVATDQHPGRESERSTSPTLPAKPTPAEFFPTKHR